MTIKINTSNILALNLHYEKIDLFNIFVTNNFNFKSQFTRMQ